MDVFERFDLRPVVNGAGGATRIGGALPGPDVVRAMSEAYGRSLLPLQVQAEASRRIASATGADAGIVTSGASAALTLSAAAVLARLDVARMDRLPETGGMANELLIARPHRNGYDRAFRLAGARLTEVGMDERAAGAGGRRTESWEYEAAVTDRTAGVVYVARAEAAPPLEEVIRVARDVGLPVIVDAAGVAPPLPQIRRLVEAGADLVAVSGGKALRAPPSSGLLCGRKELVASAVVQSLDTDEAFDLWDPPDDLVPPDRVRSLPRQGVGRGFKVSPAQVVGFLVALERHLRGETEAGSRERLRLLETLADDLSGLPLRAEIERSGAEGWATLRLELLPEAGLSAVEASRRLREGAPPVYLGEKELEAGALVVDPLNLTEEDHAVVLSRLRDVLGGS